MSAQYTIVFYATRVSWSMLYLRIHVIVKAKCEFMITAIRNTFEKATVAAMPISSPTPAVEIAFECDFKIPPAIHALSLQEKSWWRHKLEVFSVLLTLWEGNTSVTDGFPSQRASNTDLLCFQFTFVSLAMVELLLTRNSITAMSG